jgi:hypothetical protein
MNGANVTLYASISAIRTRATWLFLASPGQAPQARLIFGFDFPQRSATDLRLRYEHEIESICDVTFVSTEALTEKSLRPIPLGRATNPPARRNTQTGYPDLVLGYQQSEQRPVEPQALTKDRTEIC